SPPPPSSGVAAPTQPLWPPPFIGGLLSLQHVPPVGCATLYAHMNRVSIALVFVRVFAPHFGVRHVFGNGLWGRDPVLSDPEGAKSAFFGQEAELGATETGEGRRLGERDEPLVFQRPPSLRTRWGECSAEISSAGRACSQGRGRYRSLP